MTGRLVRIAGLAYEAAADGKRYVCSFRGRLKRGPRDATRLAAVGDVVEFTPSGAGEGIIESVAPRRSKLSRTDPGSRRREQVIVANLDAVLIVQAAAKPDLDLLTVDRCTVMAQAAGVEAAVCINKTDLAEPGTADLYAALGLPVFRTCAIRGTGLEELRGFLAGRFTVFLGPSGVGKSSLLNALNPDLELRTGAVSARTEKGKHTTTWVEILEPHPGMLVADTPGLEIFALWGVTPGNLRDHFPEFAGPAAGCRFRDCAHEAEPGCAVLAAVDAGSIAPSRHANYLRIRRDLTERAASIP